ncbi:Imm21 family immunity protein [Streptomyces sp. NPDC012600]|uniref:Imm21 family immunity protein n=1 Tax=Streptomyces sp. NPDC012600 TaxID=3415005 RepID=UPI003C2C472B
MEWLDTDFGYYALCPEPYLTDWEGTEADAVGIEYVGRVPLPDHGEVLTLGGEPSAITYLDRTMTFIRWHAADNDTGLENAVERSMASDEWQDVFDIDLGGRYSLLDSAARGDEISEADVIRVDVPPGRYRVQSLFISPSEDASFMLERLLKM